MAVGKKVLQAVGHVFVHEIIHKALEERGKALTDGAKDRVESAACGKGK